MHDSKFPFFSPSSPDPALRAIEADLAALARRAGGQGHAGFEGGIPFGLTERVFDVSVAHLPGAPSLPFAPRANRRLLTWSRMALAACVGLAVVIAGSLDQHTDSATSEFDILLAADHQDNYHDAYDREVGALLASSEVSSWDVTGELSAAFPELDM